MYRDWEEDGGGKVPASHSIRGVFGVLQERLAEFDGETEGALGWNRQCCLERRWAVVSVREEKRGVVDHVRHELICAQC